MNISQNLIKLHYNKLLKLFIICFYSLILFACDSENNTNSNLDTFPDSVKNSMYLQTSHICSGVYIGRGLILTNWHCVISSALFNIYINGELNIDHYLKHYNSNYDSKCFSDNENHESLIDTYLCITDYYCLYNGVDYNINNSSYYITSEADNSNTNCTPLNKAGDMTCNPSLLNEYNIIKNIDQILYANMELDIAIIEVKDSEILDTYLTNITIDSSQPVSSQKVTVAGHPKGIYPAITENCLIIESNIQNIQDPDNINPSILTVPSFIINCETPTHGSSGSPVFDSNTGNLLGLIWTGDNNGNIYVSAAAGWKNYLLNNDNIELHSFLNVLLKN